jgi:HEAT repeat protein
VAAAAVLVVTFALLLGQSLLRSKRRDTAVADGLRVAKACLDRHAFDRAMQEIQHVLTLAPSHGPALDAKREVIARAKEDVDVLSRGFQFTRAAEVISWIEGFGAATEDLVAEKGRYTNLAYRKLQEHAEKLSLPEAPLRRKATGHFGRPSEFFSLPYDQAVRLISVRLLEEQDDDVRSSLCGTAGALRLREAVPALCRIASGAPSERLLLAAVKALADIGDPSATGVFLATLKKRSAGAVEAEAARGLAVVDATSGVSDLIALLEEEDRSEALKLAVVEVLGRLTAAEAAPSLQKLLSRTAEPEKQIRIVRALGELKVAAVRADLEALATSSSVEAVRKAAILALGGNPDPLSFSALARLLAGHPAAAARRHAAEALGQRPEEGRDEALLAALGDVDATVRAAAAAGLSRRQEHVPRLLDLLARDQAPEVQSSAALALGRLASAVPEVRKPVGLALVKRMVESTSSLVQSTTAWALGDVGDPSALTPLVFLLEGTDESDIEGTMKGVGKTIISLLKSPQSSERSPLETLIDEVGVFSILIPPLASGGGTGRMPAKGAAASAIGRILERQPDRLRSEAGVAALVKLLRTHSDPKIRMTAAEALGRTKLEAATEALRRAMIEEEDRIVLAQAAVGLARQGFVAEATDHFKGIPDPDATECLALARVFALSGDATQCLASVDRAVVLGLSRPALIENEEAFVPLRKDEQVAGRLDGIARYLRRRVPVALGSG